MAKITKQEVEHVARLANLKLSKAEVEKFSGQLSEVLNYMEQLKEVDVEGIEPTSQTTGLTNVFADDVVDKKRMLNQKQALSNGKRTRNGYFEVPAVLVKSAE